MVETMVNLVSVNMTCTCTSQFTSIGCILNLERSKIADYQDLKIV